MGFLDRLLGREKEPEQPRQSSPQYQQYGQGYPQQSRPQYGSQQPRQPQQTGQLTDEQALDRYRYMLRTAPPETIEQAHAEAFAQLTPEQRRMLLEQLSENVPPNERAALQGTP